MSNRELATSLDVTDPLQDFDYYNKKYDGDYLKIMQGGTKPNVNVNKKLENTLSKGMKDMLK